MHVRPEGLVRRRMPLKIAAPSKRNGLGCCSRYTRFLSRNSRPLGAFDRHFSLFGNVAGSRL